MVTANYDGEIKAIKDDMTGLRSDLQTLVKTLGDDAKAKGSAAVNKARSEAGHYADEAMSRGRDGVAAVEAHIEERPFTSVLMAFGIGLVIGKLLDR